RARMRHLRIDDSRRGPDAEPPRVQLREAAVQLLHGVRGSDHRSRRRWPRRGRGGGLLLSQRALSEHASQQRERSRFLQIDRHVHHLFVLMLCTCACSPTWIGAIARPMSVLYLITVSSFASARIASLCPIGMSFFARTLISRSWSMIQPVRS